MDQYKKQIIDNLNAIENEISRYKTTKNFVQTIDNLCKQIDFNIYKELFSMIKNGIEEYDENSLKKINVILNGFIETNQKKYLNKITNTDWIVYEYIDNYAWHILNKKIDVSNTFNFLFKKNEIEAIYIDNKKRNTIEIEKVIDDILFSEKTKIMVKK